MNKIIFKTPEKDFKSKDVVDALKKAGIKNRDVLMVHADLARFGKLGEITDKKEFVDVFIDAFLQVIGEEGTLLVPTFTYSFCNNEIYDPENTPSAVGLFTEELRKRETAFRSIHPIFSVAAVGKRAKELTSNLSKNSFGKGSIYDKLLKIKNSKYVIFGVDYFACTQIHYIEETLKAPYRYVKKFKGKIRNKNEIYNDEYEYFVRPLDKNIIPDFSKIENRLLKKRFLKKVQLGNASVSAAKISDIFNEGVKIFKKDPNIFLKKTEEIEFKRFPFFTGAIDSPDVRKTLLALPFVLRFDPNLGLIMQRYSKKTEAMLNKAYKKGSSLSTPLGKGSFGLSRANEVLKQIIEICPKIEEKSFLEVGCGDGYLLWRLKKMGAKEVAGVDPGKDAGQGKKKFGINIINNFYQPELLNQKFDFIFSAGFLEHVKNPLETIQSFKKNLKQRGKIFTAVPNCENKLKLGDIGILAHEHWCYFTAESLKNLFLKSGLSDVKTALGRNEAVLYAWGTDLNNHENAEDTSVKGSAEIFFNKFSEKVRNILCELQAKIDKLDKENKTLALYAGGLQLIGILNHKLTPRFFDGDTAVHGKYFPGYKNPIENPTNLIRNKVDELWIMATDYDKEIIDYLKKEIKIPESTEIFSFKNYLENFKA